MQTVGWPHAVMSATLALLSLTACGGEPTTRVDVRPYTVGVRPTLPPGEHWVDFSGSIDTLFGRETSRDLVCLACAGDPAVAVLQMQLFRLDPAGPVLVARTDDVPATGPVMFEHDVREVPVGTEFLLRVTFRRGDGTSEVGEKRGRITPDVI